MDSHNWSWERICMVICGEPEASTKFFNEFWPKVLRDACKIMWNESDGEDLAGEFFLNLPKILFALKDPAALDGYVHSVISNMCIDKIRKRKRRLNLLYSAYRDGLLASSDSLEQHEAEEMAADLRYMVSLLPEDEHRVIIYQFFGEQSLPKIAVLMGLSYSVVRTLFLSALARLTRWLSEGLD